VTRKSEGGGRRWKRKIVFSLCCLRRKEMKMRKKEEEKEHWNHLTKQKEKRCQGSCRVFFYSDFFIFLPIRL